VICSTNLRLIVIGPTHREVILMELTVCARSIDAQPAKNPVHGLLEELMQQKSESATVSWKLVPVIWFVKSLTLHKTCLTELEQRCLQSLSTVAPLFVSIYLAQNNRVCAEATFNLSDVSQK